MHKSSTNEELGVLFILNRTRCFGEFWCQPYGGQPISAMENIHLRFLSVFPQFRLLKIYVVGWQHFEGGLEKLYSGVEFTNLKQLSAIRLSCHHYSRSFPMFFEVNLHSEI